MFLVLRHGSREQVEAFLAGEPYTHAGLFVTVTIELFDRFVAPCRCGFPGKASLCCAGTGSRESVTAKAASEAKHRCDERRSSRTRRNEIATNWLKPQFSAVAQMVGFRLGRSKMLYHSMGID
jgi:hypothetical protein